MFRCGCGFIVDPTRGKCRASEEHLVFLNGSSMLGSHGLCKRKPQAKDHEFNPVWHF